ncbi:MAG: aminotransferase class I/II-fold pyridoxal phosphate-dependent enzyme, partial [Gemmatimonadota bacterium]
EEYDRVTFGGGNDEMTIPAPTHVIGDTETPIVPVHVGPMKKTFEFWKALYDVGVFTNPVVPPAVPEGSCRLRTSFMATHTDEQLDTVLERMAAVGNELDVV